VKFKTLVTEAADAIAAFPKRPAKLLARDEEFRQMRLSVA
jgi:hypothetical protein